MPGRWLTAVPYPLYLIGPRFSPWLVDRPGTGLQVAGELYRVDAEELTAMDRLERIDRPHGYRRQAIAVIGEGGERRRVQAYLKPPEQLIGADIRLGPLAEYLPTHAALYRPRGETAI